MNTLPLDPARAASCARVARAHPTDRFLGIMGLSFSGAELAREAEEQARHLARQRMLATAPAQAELREIVQNDRSQFFASTDGGLSWPWHYDGLNWVLTVQPPEDAAN